MLLVDAYNVLHHPEAHALGPSPSLAGLAALIGRSRYAGRRTLLVCDGMPPPGFGAPARAGGGAKARLGGVELVFSGRVRSADDELEDRLRALGGAGVALVSDDRRLRRAAARARAKAMPSSTFLSHLRSDAEARRQPLPRFVRDIPLDRYSVAHWAREFGVPAPHPPGVGEPRGPAPASAPAPAGAGEPAHAPAPGSEADADRLPDERVLRLESLADDPVIREALAAWRGRLRIEDLDMEAWLARGPRPPRPRD